MKKSLLLSLLLLLLLLYSFPASAQLYKDSKYLEYSNLFKRYYYRDPAKWQFGAGLAASRGDFCGSWNCNKLGIYLNAGMYGMVQPGISGGVELDYFRRGAEDKYPKTNIIRNFRSNNVALTGILKINLLKDRTSYPGKISRKPPKVMPYLRVGVGAMVYSVKSYYNKEQFNPETPDKKPVKYPQFAVVVPVGGGLSIRYNYQITIQPELTYHFTNSDALDGAVGLLPTRKYDGYGIASVKVQHAF